MREERLNLEKYGIDKERYMELKYVCLQYAANKTSKDERRRNKAAAVEMAAQAASPALARYIVRNVTERTRYEEMPVPAGINQFFRARRQFFVFLNELIA